MRINTDKLGALGWILAILAIIFFVIMGFSGCTTTKYVPIKESHNVNTVTEHHDSVMVNERIVYVNVPLPVVKYVNITKDTTSTLQDGLYKSNASIRNGILTHTLETLPGAKLNTKVNVQDTTKTHDKSISKTTLDSIPTPYPVYKTKYIDKPMSWWGKMVMKIGYAGLIAILIIIAYYGIKGWKKLNITYIIRKIIGK